MKPEKSPVWVDGSFLLIAQAKASEQDLAPVFLTHTFRTTGNQVGSAFKICGHPSQIGYCYGYS